jgi:hypothetical protein
VITLKHWKDGRAPRGTIFTNTPQPYLKTKEGMRYEITAELADEIKRLRRNLKTELEIYDDLFRKKLDPNSHQEWRWYACFGGACDGMPTREMIAKHVAAGNKVKAGYTTTDVREYHDRWILIR